MLTGMYVVHDQKPWQVYDLKRAGIAGHGGYQADATAYTITSRSGPRDDDDVEAVRLLCGSEARWGVNPADWPHPPLLPACWRHEAMVAPGWSCEHNAERATGVASGAREVPPLAVGRG